MFALPLITTCFHYQSVAHALNPFKMQSRVSLDFNNVDERLLLTRYNLESIFIALLATKYIEEIFRFSYIDQLNFFFTTNNNNNEKITKQFQSKQNNCI